MSNILSNCFTSLPLGCNLPTVSAPSIFTLLKVAWIGPSLPKSVEYTCQPSSIVAEKMISAWSPLSIFNSEEKCTGSIIWACAATAKRTDRKSVTNLFILLQFLFAKVQKIVETHKKIIINMLKKQRFLRLFHFLFLPLSANLGYYTLLATPKRQ